MTEYTAEKMNFSISRAEYTAVKTHIGGQDTAIFVRRRVIPATLGARIVRLYWDLPPYPFAWGARFVRGRVIPAVWDGQDMVMFGTAQIWSPWAPIHNWLNWSTCITTACNIYLKNLRLLFF